LKTDECQNTTNITTRYKLKLFIGGAEFADSVVFTLPNNIPTLSVERIILDEEFVDARIEQANQSFKLAVLPELLCR